MTEVFAHFGVPPVESCYPWAPVFHTRLAGRPAVIKRTSAGLADWLRALAEAGLRTVTPLELDVTNPARIGERWWVAYPWIDGRIYDGSPADVAAAGDLLGRLHAAAVPDGGVPRFGWPDHDAASVAEDVDGLRAVLSRHLPAEAGPLMARLEPWIAGFMTDTLPPIRDGALPATAVPLDFKATNLVYAPGGPVLVDPDNAEYAPRILDLALAVLLFHYESDTSPGQLFTGAEWVAFRDAYLRHVRLTRAERDRWPDALRYMFLEWGVWTLIDCTDWHLPRQRAFLADLVRCEPGRFPLGQPTRTVHAAATVPSPAAVDPTAMTPPPAATAP